MLLYCARPHFKLWLPHLDHGLAIGTAPVAVQTTFFTMLLQLSRVCLVSIAITATTSSLSNLPGGDSLTVYNFAVEMRYCPTGFRIYEHITCFCEYALPCRHDILVLDEAFGGLKLPRYMPRCRHMVSFSVATRRGRQGLRLLMEWRDQAGQQLSLASCS